METIITNANLILDREIVPGTLCFDAAGIRGIDACASRNPAAIDAQGDFLAPGLIRGRRLPLRTPRGHPLRFCRRERCRREPA